MGKKVKNKKSGMQKRKQQKQQQKAKKRRATAKRHTTSQEQQIMRLIREIPTLAYEGPYEDFQFDGTLIQEKLDQGLSDPYAIHELTTEAIALDIQTRMAQVLEILPPESTQMAMAQNIFSSWVEHGVKASSDPVVVALYLRSKATLQGETLGLNEIGRAVQGYLKQHESDLVAIHEAGDMIEEAPANALIEQDAEVTDVESSPTQTWTQRYVASLDQAQQDAQSEDLEVFLEDFLDNTMPESASQVQTFLNEWFPQNLNPTEEDIQSMHHTLQGFFHFLGSENGISSEEASKAQALFETKAETA